MRYRGKIISVLMIFCLLSLCSCTREYDDEPIYTQKEEADISSNGCFVVFLIGSKDMTVTDLANPNMSISTYDLDDYELGQWKKTESFNMCHYKWHQYGTTSPENWYLIRPNTENYEIVLDGYNIYSVSYDNKTYKIDEYDNIDNGKVVLINGTVEYREVEI